MLIKIVNGAVRFGANTIIEDINFEIKDKDHIAIVGRNGSGKSTLLKSILGIVELEEGISLEKFQFVSIGSPKIGYICQENIHFDDTTLLDEILKCYEDIVDIENKINDLESKMCYGCDEDILDEYHYLREQYKYIGGYSYKKEYETAIDKFGFKEEDKYKRLSDFSLGQRTKITLMILLLSKPDILLLDEPTNHLDIVTISWLEKYLRDYPKSFVVVSHDRMFLDRVVNVVYEIEYGCLTKYKGNYSDFLKQKREQYEKQLKDYEYQQREIKRLTRICERFKYKPSKASMALSKLKQIEHMVMVERPNKYDVRTFKTNFVPKVDSYKEVLKIKNLMVGYVDVLKVINLSVEKGDKIGIIGQNGCGKSTFLKTIMGIIPPLGGKIVFGERVEIGYFDQEMIFDDDNNSVYEEIKSEYWELSQTEIRNSLGAFEFSGEDVNKKIKDLSGGEKVRLMLCKIMLKRPNLLILDEPTNHLDMIGKESLERILNSYNGTMLFVSHDRYFVRSVASSLLVFEKDVKYYPYGYLEYEEKESNFIKDYVSSNVKKDVILKNNSAYLELKNKNKMERRLKKIEDDIEKLEDKISFYNNEMMKEEIYLDINKCREFQMEINTLNLKIKDLEAEWYDISDLII